MQKPMLKVRLPVSGPFLLQLMFGFLSLSVVLSNKGKKPQNTHKKE